MTEIVYEYYKLYALIFNCNKQSSVFNSLLVAKLGI